ncbi:MAG: SDR family oxidoreductase [Alphaproteobacteria bacterium]|nr:SDR family oxidoreductase [Alphaproteobacteria bacterium]
MSAPIAVILGAAGAIGSSCCRAFAGAGYRVAAADLRLPEAERAIASLLHDPLAMPVDVTDVAALASLARDLAARGRITALVYAPGLVMTAAIDRTDWASYRRLMAVNLDGAFYAAAAFTPVMRGQNPSAAMVFIASTAGRRGEAGATHYCASKFGLIGFGESLAAELAPESIRVNMVCPGNVDTPMLRQVAQEIATYRGVARDSVWESLQRAGAATRLVQPDEVAAVCASLCDRRFSATTGATLTVDAGAMVG